MCDGRAGGLRSGGARPVRSIVWRGLGALALIAVFVTALWGTIQNLPEGVHPLSGDERDFVEIGTELLPVYGRCLMLDPSAWTDPVWGEKFNNYGSPNPRIGVFILGAAALVIDRTLGPESRAYSLRVFMALVSACTAVVVVWIASQSASPLAGGYALLLMMLHPIIRMSRVLVVPETPMLLFALLALAFLVAGLGRGNAVVRPTLLVLAGLLAGVAVGTKLYGVALLPAFLVLCLLRGRKLGRRGWAFVGLGLLLGVVVFFISNPLLIQSPALCIRAMTIGHLETHGGAFGMYGAGMESVLLMLRRATALWGPATLPYHNVNTEPIPGFSWVWSLLLLLGVTSAIIHRRVLPLMWLLGCVVVVGWVVSRLPMGWFAAKTCMLPSFAVVMACACFDPLFVALAVFRRRKVQGEA